MIELVLFGLLFCTAVSLLFRHVDGLHIMQSEIKGFMYDKAVHEVGNQEEADFIVYQSEVIACLMGDSIDYPMLIDGYRITKETHNKQDIAFHMINKSAYNKQYQYHADGEIALIILTGR